MLALHLPWGSFTSRSCHWLPTAQSGAHDGSGTDLDNAGVMQARDPQALLVLLACPAAAHLVQRMPAAGTGWLGLSMLALQCAAQPWCMRQSALGAG